MARRTADWPLLMESVLALGSAAACGLSLLWPDWIERSLGLTPDGGDGSTEWGWSIALAVAAATWAVLAWRRWRRKPA